LVVNFGWLIYSSRVYQKNLGPNSASIAAAMTTYNPDKTWEEVDYETVLKDMP